MNLIIATEFLYPIRIIADYITFQEYFDGDTGRGLGTSPQTGWTGLIVRLLKLRAAE